MGAAATASAAGDDASPVLLQLPLDLLCRAVIQPHLTPEDRQALRQASRLCRQLVNAAASGVLLDASLSEHAAAAAKLPASFRALRHVSIVNTAPTSSSGGAVAASGSCCSAAAALQEQLPALLCQLPCLAMLSFEGPADRRQQGLDIAPALAALAAAGAAAAPPQEAPPAAATPALQRQQPVQQQGVQLQPPQLTQLELRAGKLPDALLETVGRLRGLRCLQLTATSAINTSPLTALSRLMRLQLTVTPPLWVALTPLTGLTALTALHMATISPARGWGAALQLLPAASLQELVLVFADVSDADMAGVAALSQLTHLDLHCSRHLSPAAIRYLAELRQLQVLNLAHTGCQLGPAELALLGSGCTQLSQLHAEFDLRGLQEPPPPPPCTVQQLRLPIADSQCAWIAPGSPELQRPQEEQPAWAQQQQQQQQAQDLQQRFSSLSSNPGSSAGAAAAGREAAAVEGDTGLPQWPPLRHLVISSGCSLSNLHRLLHGSRQLRCLQLEGLGPSGNGVAEALAARAPQLTALQLSGCSSMSHAHCLLLGGRLRCLQSLWLRETSVPATHLSALLAGLAVGHGRDDWEQHNSAHDSSSSGVTRLRFERCSGLDDQVVRGLLPHMRALRQLEVVACDAVSEGALLQLASAAPGSSGVRLVASGCKGIGDGFGRAWQRAVAEQRWLQQQQGDG